MAQQESNKTSTLAAIAKSGVYIKAFRASDNYNEQTDTFGAGKGLERFYPNLDVDDTIAQLRAAAKQHFFTNGENYIFYKKDTNTEAADTDKIKDVANFAEVKDDDNDSESAKQKITINAKKTYPKEELGDSQNAANKLVEEVTELDNKAYFALGSLDGCQIVLDNILDQLKNIFADVQKDPLLQVLVAMAKYDNNDDKEKVKQNQADLKKLLLDMGGYKQSEIEKISLALGLALGSLDIIDGIKWGAKKASERINKNKQVYAPPQTKWKSRFNTVKKWSSKALSGTMKVAQVAGALAEVGLSIYGMASQEQMAKEQWRKVCEQLIEQKQKRYDDYEDIYTRYNDLSDSIWMLRNQFVKNFNDQCTDSLKKDFNQKPNIKTIVENDEALKLLITETSRSLIRIQNYLNGLLVEYTKLNTSLNLYLDEEILTETQIRSVDGYNRFIKSVGKRQQLNDKLKARYIDIYVLYLLHTYYSVKEESKINQILPYDIELEGIINNKDKPFPTFEEINGVSVFGEKEAPIKQYIQQMRITYLYFDATRDAKSDASSPESNNGSNNGSNDGPTVTFSFVQKVQELYDSQKK